MTGATTGTMTGNTNTVTDDPARIGALLAGRSAPRERIARALATHIAPLADASLAALLGGEARIAPSVGEAPDAPGRWARLAGDGGPAHLHLPDRAVAAMGTAMLGGTAPVGDAIAPPATPVDWHLAALVVDALGGALPAPLRHDGWCDAPPTANDRAAATVRVEFGGATFSFGLLVPVAALAIRAAAVSSTGEAHARKNDGGADDPRRAASIAATATLDLEPRTLRSAFAIAPGDVLPLRGSLGAITVRADGRAVLTGALGHAGGHLCLRVAERAPEPLFAALGADLAPIPRPMARPDPESGPDAPPRTATHAVDHAVDHAVEHAADRGERRNTM